MSDLEILENKALMVLLMEYHLHKGQFRHLASTLTAYGVKFPDHLLEPAISPWVKNGWVKLYRGHNGLAAKVRSENYGEVYKQVSSFLGATSFSVHAESKEVWSDVSPNNDTPMLEGWKWLSFASTEKVDADERSLAELPTAFPVPPKLSFWHSVDWTKWGAIFGGLGIVVAILIAVLD